MCVFYFSITDPGKPSVPQPTHVVDDVPGHINDDDDHDNNGKEEHHSLETKEKENIQKRNSTQGYNAGHILNKDDNIGDDDSENDNDDDDDDIEEEVRMSCFSRLESRPRRCVLVLIMAWALLVVITLPNVLQLFVRGRSVAAVILAWTFNVLPIPLVVYNP